MKIAIVDDLNSDRTILRKKLLQYASTHFLNFSIFEYSCGDDFEKQFKPKNFNVVFLDIYMPGKNGLEIARGIYDQDKTCKIIFLTTSLEHAHLSYSVRAAYYLVKPIDQHAFLQAMDFCQLHPSHNDIIISVVSNRVPVDIVSSRIMYIDMLNRQVKVHLTDQVLGVAGTFREITAPLLHHPHFLSCYKGVIVNMCYINRQNDDRFILHNGEGILIRQRGNMDLRKQFLEFSAARMRKK